MPALHLLHPKTGITRKPEDGLQTNEWVLLAGETLQFLTGGAIQAPIHSVPFVDRINFPDTRKDRRRKNVKVTSAYGVVMVQT